MKYKYFKHLKHRVNFVNKEVGGYFLKSICNSVCVELTIRQRTRMVSLNYFYKRSFVKIRNMCIFTNRGRGVHSFSKMSRSVLKEFMLFGFFSGYGRGSW
jgi:ribosomal protein S14